MSFILDTSVAIDLRDGVTEIEERLAELSGRISLSIITRVELEGGAAGSTPDALRRRERLNVLLEMLPVLPFGSDAADAYRLIVESVGFSRRKIVDRMIASQAVAAGATLVTRNAADVRDVPGLTLLEW